MTTQTQTATKAATPQLCRGCDYLEGRYKTKQQNLYKCIASGKRTFPDRTACSLWKKRP